MAGFKKTKIGTLPIDWDVKKIDEVYEFTIKPRDLDTTKLKLLPFIPMDMVPNDKLLVKDFELRSTCELSSGTYIENGDLLVAKITPSFENGKQAIVDIKHEYGFATTEVIPIKEKHAISNKYFLYFYLLKNDIRCSLAGKMEGTTGRQRLSKHILGETLIPFPTVSEQKAIANELIIFLSAIEVRKEIIRTTTELKKALMKKLFTEGLHNEQQKMTEVGLVPKSWNIVPIRELVLKTENRDPNNNPKALFKYIDVSSVSNEYYRVVNHQEMYGNNAPSRARKVVITGDVIFATVRPTLKRIAKINSLYNNEICSTGYCVLRADSERINNDYMFHYLATNGFIARVAKHQRGASYPAISDNDIKNELIPLPSIDEQMEIADVLSSMDSKIENAHKTMIHLKSLFAAMLHKLMTGQIRVN